MKRADEPFRFYTRLCLSELMGLRATNLRELVAIMREAPDSCIYYHTHRFLQQHQYLSPEPPNDFAYWVLNALGEKDLSEQLSSIDTVQFPTIGSLRDELVSTVGTYLAEHSTAQSKFASPDEAFHFMKSVSFVLPTQYNVYDICEFAEVLKKVTVDSIYFHIFESRLRLGRGMNDFSNWIENALGEKMAAAEIARLDPYTHTLDELRAIIVRIIEKKCAR